MQEMVPTLFQRRSIQSHVKLSRLLRRFIVSEDLATCDADAIESRARHVYASPHPELVHRPEHAGLPRTPPLRCYGLQPGCVLRNVHATATSRPAVPLPNLRRQLPDARSLAHNIQRRSSLFRSTAWHDGVDARLLYSYHWHLRRGILDCPLGPCDPCVRARHIRLGPRRRDQNRKGICLAVPVVFPLHTARGTHRSPGDGSGQ